MAHFWVNVMTHWLENMVAHYLHESLSVLMGAKTNVAVFSPGSLTFALTCGMLSLIFLLFICIILPFGFLSLGVSIHALFGKFNLTLHTGILLSG